MSFHFLAMKRSILLATFSLLVSLATRADHITGGEMYYTLVGVANNQYLYKVTLKLFMRCNSGRQFADPTIVSVFDKHGARVIDLTVPLTSQEEISLSTINPCISNPPTVCYDVGRYEFNVSLPPSQEGYILASQVNYRIAGISNLALNYGLIGATYTCDIPGIGQEVTGPQNNGAHFTGTDLVIVCANNSMSYSFAAEDKDGDQLQYSFCEAYQSGSNAQGTAPPPPPYPAVPYESGFSGASPLGPQVHIDPNTGLITGLAPPAGIYVVTVCVNEIRNGKIIATQRKDLQINIAACTIAAASLPPQYMLCRDTKTITVSNQSTSPLIHTYNWDFFNAAGAHLFNSTAVTPTYTFPDTGIYKIKLIINNGEQCSDSATSTALVYPGFIPAFTSTGICFTKPTLFADKTTTVYGAISSWLWDFGEINSYDDFSDQRKPSYTYPSMGVKNINLIVTNTNGCIDTAAQMISIVDKPPVQLLFRDSLICTPDVVQLHAQGNGSYSWTPIINIINANTPSPTVSPVSTITYYVQLDDDGCINRDSVLVRVTDHVDIKAMSDTIICQDDPVQLRVESNGFQFHWSPATQFINAETKNAVCITHVPTRYEVTGRIGSCSGKDDVFVNTVPYPIARAGNDTTICHGDAAQLHGYTDGNSFGWSPLSGLSNPTTLDPVARPISTTVYVLSASDNRGCPKPGRDTVVVNVLTKIIAYAGRDTSVVVGQPLQLQASGGLNYFWSPSIGLSANNISNPIAVYTNESTNIKYRVLVFNMAGCVDSAFVHVKVFGTAPTVFVPNAFTPNSDGHNDMLKPILAGVQRIEYFKVYNKWGQLLFSTSENGRGWDGRVSGQLQVSGTYVWMVKAYDYKGSAIFQKGLVMLIR